ncbi:MAG: malate synthase A [Thermonemataceae bacterium]|nr:malate synthase A [Thermonemataceae bacterium]
MIKILPANTYPEILTKEAQEFLLHLHQKFSSTRQELLQKRQERAKSIQKGNLPDFLPETQAIREGSWQVATIPQDLQDRRVEITGPVDKKMVINALNSGAKVFMADFEDANAPTWDNCLEGQINLKNANLRQIDFTAENGKTYQLNEQTAVLKVRPRGWHLVEKHFLIANEAISASLFDFGLYFFHNAKNLLAKGTAPYFYLPKLESHLEARLWNEVFVEAQNYLQIPQGTIKVTVLIETILAAYEMEEIIYELREHLAGLNAGRWDYIFSTIKKLHHLPEAKFPDRSQITMQVPFMRAYAQNLVKVCHKRGAHAIGGMSAFIPSRKDEEVNKNAFAKVKADKELEASNGYDGTWVAHPDLVAVAQEAFDKVLGSKKHQKEILREDVQVTAEDLRNFSIEGGKITEQGLRANINVGILYIESWLSGLGAAALYNLMEDAATAEISRAQVWQWLKTKATLEDGRIIDIALYEDLRNQEIQKCKDLLGEARIEKGYLDKAIKIFDELVKDEHFVEFLTIPAYEHLS